VRTRYERSATGQVQTVRVGVGTPLEQVTT
jgi:hypothetical protein